MIEFLKIMLDGRMAKAEERGATAVEYGLLVALIAAVIVAVVVTLGQKINTAFTTVNNSL
jgi:pilus assembly protein Flp/PilA